MLNMRTDENKMFQMRVRVAKIELRAGYSEEYIRRIHGSIVLLEAKHILASKRNLRMIDSRKRA